MTITRTTHPSAGVLTRAVRSLLPALDLCAEALRRHHIRRSYGRMSDAQLRDIGLTPWELEVALSQPLDQSAGDALARAAASEAGRW